MLGGRVVKRYQGPRCGNGTTWRQIRSPVLQPGSPARRPMTPWAFLTQRDAGKREIRVLVIQGDRDHVFAAARCWQQLANQSPNIE